ncbi:hypothetical protein [Litorisediminicola beolgyonensis]|uniref:DUF4340 domain-containing protein n=1 Tax=Litorisediminicola beolgyonensis TaxID=1173614 RepID=A0ABW3ZLN9_9RHOB
MAGRRAVFFSSPGWRLVVLAAFATAAAFFAGVIATPSPQAALIAPKALENGLVEYRLVDFGADGVRFTEDDPVWVLRFPSSYDVQVPDLRRSQEQREANPAWKNNWELGMRLGPSGEPVTESTDLSGEGIALRVTAARVDYGDPGGDGWLLGSTFSAQVSRMAQYQCHPEIEEFPGIWRLREQRPAETAELRARLSDELGVPESRTGFVGKCRIEGTNFDRYIAYHEDGAVMGQGTCSRSERGTCTLTVWLPQRRETMLQFDRDRLSELRRIYASVVDLFTRATVSDP